MSRRNRLSVRRVLPRFAGDLTLPRSRPSSRACHPRVIRRRRHQGRVQTAAAVVVASGPVGRKDARRARAQRTGETTVRRGRPFAGDANDPRCFDGRRRQRRVRQRLDRRRRGTKRSEWTRGGEGEGMRPGFARSYVRAEPESKHDKTDIEKIRIENKFKSRVTRVVFVNGVSSYNRKLRHR